MPFASSPPLCNYRIILPNRPPYPSLLTNCQPQVIHQKIQGSKAAFQTGLLWPVAQAVHCTNPGASHIRGAPGAEQSCDLPYKGARISFVRSVWRMPKTAKISYHHNSYPKKFYNHPLSTDPLLAESTCF